MTVTFPLHFWVRSTALALLTRGALATCPTSHTAPGTCPTRWTTSPARYGFLTGNDLIDKLMPRSEHDVLEAVADGLEHPNVHLKAKRFFSVFPFV